MDATNLAAFVLAPVCLLIVSVAAAVEALRRRRERRRRKLRSIPLGNGRSLGRRHRLRRRDLTDEQRTELDLF